MKLYLHCGYHKTGSSFLQTLFSRNRDYLQKKGFHFPVASREYDMQSGKISPGNGPELAAALKKNDIKRSSDILNEYVSEAEKKGVDKILLSSENFFHAFENTIAIETLMNAATENGITDIHALLYFRDPVSHALSTFKHRAKKGGIADFEDWLGNEYETMTLTEQFLTYQSQFPIQWTCRKYSPDSVHMAESSFSDWLGLESPEIPKDDRVNTSLTLSELVLIQTLNEARPSYIPYVRQAFAGVPVSEKCSDKSLNAKYTALASVQLQQYRDLIDQVNQLLPENELLKIPVSENAPNLSDNNDVTLTNVQIDALISGIEAGAKSERVLQKSRAIISKVVDKINRKIKILTA